MRPKTKNTNIFHAQTTKNTKNKTTKKKKQTTTIIIVIIFIAFASTIQFSHNTPPHKQHPPKDNPKRYHQADLVYLRGDLIEQHSCCSRHPTACHTTKQTIKTQTHFAETPPTSQPAEKASPCFIDPPTRTTIRAGNSPPKNLCHQRNTN